ncbi:MAG: DUF4921 family protein [Pirellulaceae bacterium]
MSDLRYDPVFDLWVAVAESRRDRPIEFVPVEQTFKQLICPFCCGNEEETPPEIFRLDEKGCRLTGGGPSDWQARVIPNKYPTYFENGQEITQNEGPYRQAKVSGTQELIIPTPRHVFSLTELSGREFEIGLLASQMRIEHNEAQESLKHNMLFANCRYEAGASVAHVHFQLIASPIVSPQLQRRQLAAEKYRKENSTSLLASILDHELQSQVRVVAETNNLVMFCPFASRYAFQVWIVPKANVGAWVETPMSVLSELCDLSSRYLKRIEMLLSEPAYNWMLHQLPMGEHNEPWFIEIVPRIAKNAGYEIGTDIWINPVAPEVAARRLKS